MSEIDSLHEAEDNKINSTDIPKDNDAIKSTAEIEDIAKTPSETTDGSVQVIDADIKPHNINISQKQLDASEIADANEHDNVLNEIDDSNAEDAEDEGNKDRHTIELKEYDKMSLEELTSDLDKLVKNEKVQAIKSHVEAIKKEFDSQFNDLLEEKKNDFLNDGGNEIDFYYSSPIQKQFKNSYNAYRKKLQEHRKNLEQNLKENLANKLEIIEEIKGLLNVEENINTTYKHFKELQEKWRNTGSIPKDKYNNAWNSYHHHVEMFYDFLHLNRDLRDLDFKHNLEQKTKIIERAEELAQDTDILRAFRELQELHKMWKEDLGPVDREQREVIWERFKASTKIINDKRQAHFQKIDKSYEKNLDIKLEIIAKIEEINNQETKSHGAWQNKIKAIDALRNEFFNAGKVPIKVNESTWAKFKSAVRTFNKHKNIFYKGLKKEQFTNLQKKLELIKIAEDNKDNEDVEVTTSLMKKIQDDWKKIGHVPRKDSDKIWNQFKAACNHFFDRLHSKKNAETKESLQLFNKKQDLLDVLKDFKFTKDKEKDLETIKEHLTQWNAIGRVPNDKRFIEGKFSKVLDDLFSKLEMDKDELEMIKFENKLEDLNNSEDNRNIDNERVFIRKKIDEINGQINQLENNLQFFTNASEDNPVLKEVHKNIENHKDELTLWKKKLSKIKELY